MSREEAERGKKEGMTRVYQHADPAWLAGAYRSVYIVAHEQEELTSDDVIATLRQLFPGVRTHDERALGPVMQKVSKTGLIEKTGRFVKSTRKSKHAGPIEVWRRGPLF